MQTLLLIVGSLVVNENNKLFLESALALFKVGSSSEEFSNYYVVCVTMAARHACTDFGIVVGKLVGQWESLITVPSITVPKSSFFALKSKNR